MKTTRHGGIQTTDILSVIEACYDLDGDDQAWLARLSEVAGTVLDDGLGVAATLYAGGAAADTRVTHVALAHGLTAEALGRFRARSGQVEQSVGSRPPAFAGWFRRSSGLVQAIAGLEHVVASLPELGARDLYGVNGRDPSGFGVWIGAPLRHMGAPSRARDRIWDRVAAHLSAAYRLRRALRVGAAPIEARLRVDGNILEREAPLDAVAHAQLRRAVVAIDHARQRGGRADIVRATSAWTGLVSGRWTMLDVFTSEGRRYVVARKNDLVVDPLATLSQRENTVLAIASLGRSNKLIAYELGLSASTVRVLLSRAAAKLDVKHRDEAIARYRALHAAREETKDD